MIVHLTTLFTKPDTILIEMILSAVMLNPVNAGGEVDGGLHGLVLYPLYVDAFGCVK